MFSKMKKELFKTIISDFKTDVFSAYKFVKSERL
jgi:hypothetical protein